MLQEHPFIPFEENTMGDIASMIIQSPNCTQKFRMYAIDDCLNQISRGGLSLMLLTLKENRQFFTVKRKNSFILYEDLLILSLFKINQPYLRPQCIDIIKKKLSLILKRPIMTIITRIQKLKKLRFADIESAILKDYDLCLHLSAAKVEHWMKVFKKNHPHCQSMFDIKLYENGSFIFIATVNEQRYLKKKHSKTTIQQVVLTRAEIDLINFVFDQIQKKRAFLSEPLSRRRKKKHEDYLKSMDSQESEEKFLLVKKEQERNQDNLLKIETPFELKSDRNQCLNSTVQQSSKRQNISVSSFISSKQSLSDRQLQIMLTEIKRLLLLFQQSQVFKDPEILDKKFTIVNNLTGKATEIVLRAALKEFRIVLLSEEALPEAKAAIKQKISMMMEIYHFQSREHQRQLKDASQRKLGINFPESRRVYQCSQNQQEESEQQFLRESMQQMKSSLIDSKKNIMFQMNELYKSMIDLKEQDLF